MTAPVSCFACRKPFGTLAELSEHTCMSQPTPVAKAALDALSAFRLDHHTQVCALLRMWKRYSELTATDIHYIEQEIANGA